MKRNTTGGSSDEASKEIWVTKAEGEETETATEKRCRKNWFHSVTFGYSFECGG